MSQPHLHNVLKNIRALSPGSATRLLQALDLNIPELLWQGSAPEAGVRAVPLLRQRLGPGPSAALNVFAGYVPFPVSAVRGLVNPVAARLSADLAMPRAFSANDLVLLDQNPDARAAPGAESCWAVIEHGNLRVRYVRRGGTRVYLVNEYTLRHRAKWETVSLQGVPILDVIKARIVWVGRDFELETHTEPPQELAPTSS